MLGITTENKAMLITYIEVTKEMPRVATLLPKNLTFSLTVL